MKGIFDKGQGGFTLLEVLIALAILAGVVVTALSAVNYNLSVIDKDNEVITAALLGRLKAEELALSRASWTGEGRFPEPDSEYGWKAHEEDLPGFTIKRVYLSVSRGKGSGVSFVSHRE